MRPGETFAKRMARYRRRRGWSQEDLAAELTRYGMTLNQAQVAKIEGGKRGLSLDEAIGIAWVLGLPPALLYLPLGESDEFSPVPTESIHPDLARKWITGEEPATHTNQRARQTRAWAEDMWVWRLHERLNQAQDAVHANPDDREARVALRRVLLDYLRLGVAAPKHPKHLANQLAEDMREEEE